MRALIAALVITAGAVLGAHIATNAQCAPYEGTSIHAVCTEHGAHVARNHGN